MAEELYTITGHWSDGDETTDRSRTKTQIMSIVNECLGDGCVGFTIEKEE
jgi:hypothetical protein